MVSKLLLYIIWIGCLFLFCSWGFKGHRKINQQALLNLPTPLKTYFMPHIKWITALATKPDERKYVDRNNEPQKHYIDIELLCEKPNDFKNIPKTFGRAKNKFGIDSLNACGTLPWTVQHYYYKLVESMKDRDIQNIVSYSAYLGHYIADALVPLHTTKNYDGQFTQQQGIHSLWETLIPNLFLKHKKWKQKKPIYIYSTKNKIWSIIQDSHLKVDSVLDIEKKTALAFPDKYQPTLKAGKISKKYNMAFAQEYHKNLNKMTEKRMDLAIYWVSSFWYSAWIDAGQPQLMDIGLYVDSN